MKLGILGTGNMAEALLSGLLAKKVLPKKQIWGFDINPERLAGMKKKYGLNVSSSAKEVVEKTDHILLAVKPQQLSALIREIRDVTTARHLILSMAAGVDTKRLLKEFGKSRRVVRLMPNTPALVGLGATGFFLTKACSPADRKQVSRIFAAVGLAVEVKKEALLDSVTALSGSGPAFVYLFLQSLIDGATKLGLPRETAHSLTIQTVLGATTLLKTSGEKPEELIAKVASKGGTTEAGLKTLDQQNFKSIVELCLKAAHDRAQEMRKI